MLADVRIFSTILDQSWKLGKVSEDCRKANINSIFKKSKKEDPWKYKASQLYLDPHKDEG